MAQFPGEHQADYYRRLKSKFLATARKHGYNKAYYWLEAERDKGDIGPQVYHGLLGELIFNQEKQGEFKLLPTLDCGDHVDFTGKYNNEDARFDVTTNIDYKKLEDYEPFQKQGAQYYIALIDTNRRRVDRIVNINFPFCPHCNGRLVNVAHIGNTEFTNGGSPTQTQRVIKVCSNDITHNVEMGQFDYLLPSIADEQEYIADLYQEDEQRIREEFKQIPIRHGVNNSLLFSKEIMEKVHAVGHDVTTTLPDGDVDVETRLYWKSDLIDQLLPDDFEDIL